MVEQTKATRVRRVSVESLAFTGGAKLAGEIIGTFSVNGESLTYSDLPRATIEKMIAYGTTQLVNDALAGEDDKEAALLAVVARIKSGDWSAARSAGGTTMASVAADLIKANAKKAGKAVTGERVKALVAEILANPDGKGYAAVKAEYDRRNTETIDLGIEV